MSQHLLGMLCVIVAIVFEAVGQLCFKQGSEHPAGVHPVSLVRHSWRNKWLIVGTACFLMEVGFWTIALRLLPLSAAFPIGSLCFVIIAMFSRIWLGERVGACRWTGVALILLGVALIGLDGPVLEQIQKSVIEPLRKVWLG